MAEAYHQLENVIALTDASALKIPRAIALFEALMRHRDYALIELLQHHDGEESKIECLIVDVECDAVPPKNGYGIQYRERLALCVSDAPSELVEVLALRTDFPVLMHQNHGGLGSPANLCLYFEPVSTVMRTWTPQSFLKRIQWWLEKSSTGELHPADQPVEQLFFATKYELVLPWNLTSVRDEQRNQLAITRGADRLDKGFTCFLEIVPKEVAPRIGSAVPIELVMPSIIQGVVERDPNTLGELVDILQKRGVDFISFLRDSLQQRVGDGVVATVQDKYTVILLHIPVCRIEGDDPVGITRRAFILLTDVLQLGVTIGALLVHNGQYFKDVMNTHQETSWREQTIFPMSVLSFNDASAARKQSGITAEGPKGTLIGAGSLGSALLNMWTRSGWGKWTIVDKDHIKPHNLSRHVAHASDVGKNKADVLAELSNKATAGAMHVVSIAVDATDFSIEALSTSLTTSTLIVDASTSLDYPRAVSTFDEYARHISVFITPDGNGAVLLSEDASRSIRLRTLEAQYYRALIQESWGSTHLKNNISSFWSGASCRDISLVLPYSRVMVHASTLAEQIPSAAESDAAAISVWERNSMTGSVEVHNVEVLPERSFSLGEFDVFIDSGVERELRNLRSNGLPNETGGILLGYYDLVIHSAVIVACLPAPADSKATPGSFERGIAGLAEAVAEASKRTAGIVRYIGEWHSHPQGHSASPSGDDLIQLAYLALGMADDGLPAIQLIVGEDDIQVLQGSLQ